MYENCGCGKATAWEWAGIRDQARQGTASHCEAGTQVELGGSEGWRQGSATKRTGGARTCRCASGECGLEGAYCSVCWRKWEHPELLAEEDESSDDDLDDDQRYQRCIELAQASAALPDLPWMRSPSDPYDG